MSETSWFADGQLDRERLGRLVAPVLERVERAMTSDRLPHALMLAGPPGLGRELLAIDIATRLVCGVEALASIPESVARRVRRGTHPDVMIIRGEGRKSVIRIASIRRVIDEAPGRPFEGACRVWIVDGAEPGLLPTEAANAFLKVLEEPPDHVRFILLAANVQAVMPTIRSRCSTLVLPGRVAAKAGVDDDDGVPPEIGTVPEGGAETGELVAAATRGLELTMRRDLQAAISLATIMGAQTNGLEIVAAAALELAADPENADLRESYAGLAAEVLASQRAVSSLALRPDRQLLASLLRWSGGADSI